jgi:hypothetical protein
LNEKDKQWVVERIGADIRSQFTQHEAISQRQSAIAEQTERDHQLRVRQSLRELKDKLDAIASYLDVELVSRDTQPAFAVKRKAKNTDRDED